MRSVSPLPMLMIKPLSWYVQFGPTIDTVSSVCICPAEQHTIRHAAPFLRQMSLVRILTLGLLFQLSVPAALSVEHPSRYLSTAAPPQPPKSGAEWPSLRFNLSLKRSSMTVQGQSSFSMFADPVISSDGSHVAYNVFASFHQDTMVHNYTLVDGAAYYATSNRDNAANRSRVQCFDPELGHLPPINAIAAALNDAVAIMNASSDVECSSGNVFKVSVNDIEFVLCASGSSGLKLYGSDMDISVERLSTRMNISAPVLMGDKLHRCPVVVSEFEATLTGEALLTGRPIPFEATRRLKAEFDFSWGDSSSCSCKSKPRPCIFIHGMGVPYELPDNQNYFKYWGNLTDHAPCCTSMKYAVLDTGNNTWTNNTQQQ